MEADDQAHSVGPPVCNIKIEVQTIGILMYTMKKISLFLKALLLNLISLDGFL